MNGTVINFEAMSDGEMAQFIQEHQTDFDEVPVQQKAEEVLAAIQNFGAVVVRRPFGFALVYPTGSTRRVNRGIGDSGDVDLLSALALRNVATLWYFYISPAARGSGHGKRLAQDLLAEFAQQAPMNLLCHGSIRQAIFEAYGFRTIGAPEGGWYPMDSSTLSPTPNASI